MMDSAKEFLKITEHESLTLRLIAADFTPGDDHPSTSYTEVDDPFYAPQILPYTDWDVTQVDQAVRAIGPTCVFAFQDTFSIYGFWVHRSTGPDDWVIQLRYSDAPHFIPLGGGAEVVTPALQWFTGIQFIGP